MLTETELEEISEKMGEAVHNAWMAKRKKEKGWHNPDECLHITLESPKEGKHCARCHPCMRPYSELPDSEKELDREYPKQFVQILTDMGYTIEKGKN